MQLCRDKSIAHLIYILLCISGYKTLPVLAIHVWISAAVHLQFYPSGVPARALFSASNRHHPQCGSIDMIVLPSQQAIAAALTRLRQIRKTGPASEKPLTVGPFIKTLRDFWPTKQQLPCFIPEPLLQYRCHELLCQVWAALSRMQSLCVHNISACIENNTARRLHCGCNYQSLCYRVLLYIMHTYCICIIIHNLYI